MVLSGAYDRVELDFVQAMMNQMGFGARWLDLIMRCITTVSHVVKVNGIQIVQLSLVGALNKGTH